MTLLVRERPPLRLDIGVQTPSGHTARWANDDPNPANAPGALTFTSTAPGGFENCGLTLQRNPKRAYPDLELLSTITIRGAGGQVAWQGRIDTLPGQSGDQAAVSPTIVGWQAHLQDDNSAREIYIDPAITAWQGASTSNQIALLNASIDETDASVGPDTASSGTPSLITQLSGPWSREVVSQGWYDAQGIPIGRLLYAWMLQAAGAIGDSATTDTNWSWVAVLSDTDGTTTFDTTANLRDAGPSGTGELDATTATRTWALVQLMYAAASGNDGVNYPVFWPYLAVVGQHGLPIQGTLTTTGGVGILASDAIANAVSRWAPRLAFSTGAAGTIQPSSFVIPQLLFTAPTTVAAMITQAVQYELLDWFVWEGGSAAVPTFYMNARGATGRQWRAQSGPAKLQAAGLQASELWNGVIVQFTDTTGKTYTVGPPGSGMDQTDASLLDPDPLNPANQAGINKWGPLTLGTSTFADAIAAGADYLQAQKQLDTSGQAAITGHVQDTSGVWWPAWMIRGGDTISVTDASDTSPRRVISASYDDTSKTATLQLDVPPETMQAILARFGASIAQFGLS